MTMQVDEAGQRGPRRKSR